MAIPYLPDPRERPGAQLFASPSAYTGGVLNAVTPLPQQSPFPMVPNSMAAQGGIIQVPEEKPGILGRIGRGLANPAINQRLSALGAELLANSGYHQIPVTTGAGLGRGLMAMNQAGQAYDQMLGSQAAAALDKRMKEAQLKKAEREAAGQLDALKYQFGGAVITEQDGVKGFSIPVQNPQTGEISAKFVPVGSDILSRTTGLSAQDQATLDISTAGGKTEAQIRAENALADQTAAAKAKIEAATTGAGAAAKEQAAQAGAGTAIEQTRGIISEMKKIIPDAYVGSSVGARTGRAASETLGISMDPEKAANTERLKAFGTQLKFAAKPAGMGAMSDSEWGIITSAVGDPTRGSPETYNAALEALDYVLAGRMPPDSLRSQYGYKPSQKQGKPAAPAARQDLRSKYGL